MTLNEFMDNACLGKEIHKDRYLAGCRDECQQDYQGAVYNTFRNYSAYALTEIDSFPTSENATTQHLAYTGYHKAAGVGDEDGIDTGMQSGFLAQRSQSLLPTQSTEHLSHDAKGEAKEHPTPRHITLQCPLDIVPTELTIHPPQNSCG